MKKYRDKIKIVNIVLDSLYSLKSKKLSFIQDRFSDINYDCLQITKNYNLLKKAVKRNWLNSAAKIKTKTAISLNDFSYRLAHLRQTLETSQIRIPKRSDILADLIELEQEFGNVSINLEEHSVSIVTDPIILEDIPLGSFEIKLFANKIAHFDTDSPYKIIALEPNPAGSDCYVTHPHVSHERLCEGDGHIPITRAIEQGRLCDFFNLVVNILRNYNPDSPYVSIEDWCDFVCLKLA